MSKLPESMPAVDVYEPPPDGWVCFFCGERFTTYGSAAMHFGWKPSATPVCQIKVGKDRGLVMEIRRLEEHNGNLREQNFELQRQADTLRVRECPDCTGRKLAQEEDDGKS